VSSRWTFSYKQKPAFKYWIDTFNMRKYYATNLHNIHLRMRGTVCNNTSNSILY